MSPYRRNVLVGVTVLASLLILGWMIIQFGGSLAVPFQGDKMPVKFVADRADGINVGSTIKYLGQTVGTVKSIDLDIAANDVKMEAEIDKKWKLPGQLEAKIIIPNLLGAGAVIDLTRKDAADKTLLAENATIQATYVGNNIIPPNFSEVADELKATISDLRRSGVIADLKTAVNNFNGQVTKAGQVMDDLHVVLGDAAVQKNLKESIEDFRAAVADAKKTAANLDKITTSLQDFPDQVHKAMGDITSGVTDARSAIADARVAINNANDRIVKLGDSLIARSEELGHTLNDIREIADKINKGEGTAGALVNDSKLYDTLVNATQTLDETIKDVKRVTNQIEQEGIKMKF